MRLLTIGDSFTYGEELQDVNNAWPFLLSNKVGYEVNNLAQPGSGNTRMVRYAVEQIDNFDTIIIAWSHFARTEIADENGFYDIWPGCSADPYKKHSRWRKDLILYNTKYYNDDYLYRQYLINIILIQNYLKSNNKRYLMLDSFGNHQVTYRHLKINRGLINQIDPTYYVGWPQESMMEWTFGTSQGPHKHFLEDGHKKVADKIYEHIRYLGWVS